jgi:molybdenum cofactor guanylyltransferase
MPNSPTLALLAGGASRRLGQDKVALFLPALLETLLPLGLPVLVIGRAGEGARFVADDFPGTGPLGGLATALRLAEGAPTLALACDLPLMTADAVAWLLAQGADTPPAKNGLIACHPETGAYEPLFSVYHASCLTLIQERLASGRRSLQGLIEEGEFEFVTLPDEYAPCLTNVNRPEDLQALRRQ